MAYVVRTHSRAASDAQQVFNWIEEKSPEGALRWWTAFREACRDLSENPERHTLAAEAEHSDADIRQ